MRPGSWQHEASWLVVGKRESTRKMKTQTLRSTKKQSPSKEVCSPSIAPLFLHHLLLCPFICLPAISPVLLSRVHFLLRYVAVSPLPLMSCSTLSTCSVGETLSWPSCSWCGWSPVRVFGPCSWAQALEQSGFLQPESILHQSCSWCARGSISL